VNLDLKYLFFEIPKAGSTTLKTFIHRVEHLPAPKPLIGTYREAKRSMLIHDRSQFALSSLIDLDDDQQREILTSRDAFRFSIVRNPYTRLESAWKSKVRLCEPGYEAFYHEFRGRLPDEVSGTAPISFSEFVDIIAGQDLRAGDAHWTLQNRHIFYKALDFTHIGRLERFDATIRLFVQHLRTMTAGANSMLSDADLADNYAVERKNASGQSTHYIESLARRAYELYREDFSLFDYAEDAWPRPELNVDSCGTARRTVSEDAYVREIVERNVMITLLYNEIDRLRGLVHAG